MNWSDVGKSLLNFAPTIATAIGGPVGGIASIGVKAVCEMFGVGEDDPKSAIKAINSMTHEQAIKLKKADQDFQSKMAELEVDIFSLEVKDRDGARQREKEVGSFDTRWISIIMIIGFILMVTTLLVTDVLKDMDPTQLSIVSLLIGMVSNKVNTILDYFFGGKKEGEVLSNKLTNMVHQNNGQR